MKRTFFGRYALLILCTVCFLVPFAIRGARVSMATMRNEVTDWLPKTFKETAEMAWFWRHFMGERFIVVSWEGCTGTAEDETFKLFLQKLHPEVPPSRRPEAATEAKGAVPVMAARPEDSAADPSLVTEFDSHKAHGIPLQRSYDFVGDRLGLFYTGNDYFNFGGRDEKWLLGENKQWYFITPEGNLYHWPSADAPIATLFGRLWRAGFGGQIAANHIASLGPVDGPWYYANPRRLNAQLFKSATAGPQVLHALTREGGALSDDIGEARRRLSGALFGPDGKQTCLILTLTSGGRNDFHRVVGRGVLGKPRGRLYDIGKECGLSEADLRLGGPPVDNVAIDEEGAMTLVRLVSLSVLLGVGLAYACFRSVTATMIVFFVGGISAIGGLAVVGWTGATVDAILMSMPSLVYVLGISGAVHLINYYRDALEESGPVGAPEKAIRHGWKPAVLCNVTTAIGLISLCTSEIEPIRKFGLFSGLAVLGTLILLFTYLPAALEVWPQKPRSPERKKREEEPWYEAYLRQFWERLGSFIIRNHYAVAIICVLVITSVGWGVTRIKTTVNLMKMFDDDAKLLNDYAWLETHLGELVPMEVVVKVPPRMLLPVPNELDQQGENAARRHQLSFLDRMLISDRIQQVVDDVFGDNGRGIAGQSMSAATFALPSKDRYGSVYGRMAVNSALLKHRDELLESDYFRLDDQDQSELWRVSLRIAALKDIDYGIFVNDLKSAIEPIMSAYAFRETILRDVIEAETTRRRPRVLLLGAPLTTASTAEEKGNPPASGQGPTPTGNPTTGPVDQAHIFASTLKDILRAAGVDVRFHNPALEPLPGNWQQSLGQFDCVVLVSDHASYDPQAVRNAAKTLVDARQHHFDPGAETAAEKTSHLAGGQGPEPGITAVYTGVVPIVYKAQRSLLNSLIESTFWSFVTITPLMMFVCRGFSGGLIVMAPNVLPVFVIFGAMGWLGINVDLGSMMSASIALGVAVDDTIHFLTWYRDALDKTGDRHKAILYSYSHCATPTFQAALISGMGLSIFAFSTFTPTQRFGYLMLTILVAGMVAELIFMPALLAGPLGKVFKPRTPKGRPPQPLEGGPAEPPPAVEPRSAEEAPTKVHTVPHLTGNGRGVQRTDSAHVPHRKES